MPRHMDHGSGHPRPTNVLEGLCGQPSHHQRLAGPTVNRAATSSMQPSATKAAFIPIPPVETVAYIHAGTYVTSRAPGTLSQRPARVGRPRPLPLRLRPPAARAGGPRRRLHTRRALPPVPRQGGPGPRVIDWVNENWTREVREPASEALDPVAELLALARGHAVFCRRDIARVMMALRIEFSDRNQHPVGRELQRVSKLLFKDCARLIEAGRRNGSIPKGPPAGVLALAYWGALEGAVISLTGQAPYDEQLAAPPPRGCSAWSPAHPSERRRRSAMRAKMPYPQASRLP